MSKKHDLNEALTQHSESTLEETTEELTKKYNIEYEKEVTEKFQKTRAYIDNTVLATVEQIYGVWKYYTSPESKKIRKEHTIALYSKLRHAEYPKRLAKSLARSTPIIPKGNHILPAIIGFGMGFTVGRPRERHMDIICKEAGMNKKYLTNWIHAGETVNNLFAGAQTSGLAYLLIKPYELLSGEQIPKTLYPTIGYTIKYFGTAFSTWRLNIKNKYTPDYTMLATFTGIPFIAASIAHDIYATRKETNNSCPPKKDASAFMNEVKKLVQYYHNIHQEKLADLYTEKDHIEYKRQCEERIFTQSQNPHKS